MAISTVRRMAAELLGIGENRVRIRPEDAKRAAEALTRGDVKALISDGVITKVPKKGHRKAEKKERRGDAARRGTYDINRKERWMEHVRAQRKYLRELVSTGTLEKRFKRAIYMKIKSGIFRSKKAMFTYMKENNMVKEMKQ